MQVLSGESRVFGPLSSRQRECIQQKKGCVQSQQLQSRGTRKSFLGLMTYNVKFLPSLADVLHPLYSLLKKDKGWRWGKPHKKAFKKAKKLICRAPVLVHCDVTKPIKVYCDASPYGLGACLMHVLEGQIKPVAFASRTLTQAERNYAQVEHEALAIVFTVKKFHQYLYGREFTLVTDHRPLCKILGHDQGVPVLAAERIQCWSLILGSYRYRVEYTPGDKNECADCLSRLPQPSTKQNPAEKPHQIQAMVLSTLPVTAADVAKATRKDKTMAMIMHMVQSGQWPKKLTEDQVPYHRRREELSSHDGCLLWGQRVVIPASLRQHLLRELHNGHVGMSRMKALARSFVWWPGLDKEIESLASHCNVCKTVAASPHKAPRHPWQYPSAAWDRIHIDYGQWGNKHFLVIVDAFSKWPEVKLVSSTTTQRTIDVLQEVFATHGYPRLLVSDNGPQFTSEEFEYFLQSNNIAHHKSPPYHPATNGIAENMVKNVKQWLKKQGGSTTAYRAISDFLRTYRNVPHTSTGRTPAEVIFKRLPRTHLSMIVPDMTERLKNQLQPKEELKQPCSFAEDDMVFIHDHRPTSTHKCIEGRVSSKTGALSYLSVL